MICSSPRSMAKLDAWANEAAYRPVFEFYSAVLGRDRVRQRMIARLGHEAGDILDEFLSFCLAEERAGLPGLEAFLATLESAGPEIKREMDQGRDEVRIMTVHAAKGLEAPVVFLVDGGTAPFSEQHLPRLMPFDMGDGSRGYLWRSSKEVANGFSRTAEARVKEARRRRIPPAALCRHDARRGPADRLRLSRQARAQSADLAHDRQRRAGRRSRDRGAGASRDGRSGAPLPQQDPAGGGG